MNKHIDVLYQKAKQKEKLIIGLMSGTSMDGLDIALCKFSGKGVETRIELLNFETASYTDEFRQQVKSIFSKENVSLEMVCIMNEQIALTHAGLIKQTLKKWNVSAKDVDFLASHGQTIYHAPKSLHQRIGLPNATLQIGDGDHLAVHTGLITLSDFRQKHIAGGGEGAPLAVYGDYILFSESGENRLMLNIGGIANYTFLPADLDATRVFSTDVGPGNTLMDHYVQKHFPGKYFDEGALIAQSGNVNNDLLDALLANSFFTRDFPKTTGPELFSLNYLFAAQERSATLTLAPQDVLATLCEFSAIAIAQALRYVTNKLSAAVVYLSGGGMHNPLLMEKLHVALPNVVFRNTGDLKINPDAKEAVLFALLANETVMGSTINFGVENGIPPVCMGKISFPS